MIYSPWDFIISGPSTGIRLILPWLSSAQMVTIWHHSCINDSELIMDGTRSLACCTRTWWKYLGPPDTCNCSVPFIAILCNTNKCYTTDSLWIPDHPGPFTSPTILHRVLDLRGPTWSSDQISPLEHIKQDSPRPLWSHMINTHDQHPTWAPDSLWIPDHPGPSSSMTIHRILYRIIMPPS